MPRCPKCRLIAVILGATLIVVGCGSSHHASGDTHIPPRIKDADAIQQVCSQDSKVASVTPHAFDQEDGAGTDYYIVICKDGQVYGVKAEITNDTTSE